MGEATPRPWDWHEQVDGQTCYIWIDGPEIDGANENVGEVLKLEDAELIIAAVNACHALNVQNPADLEANVRVLMETLEELDRHFTGHTRPKALIRDALAPFREVT